MIERRIKKFAGKQDKLDAVYWLMKGLSYREVGEEIDRSHSFIQRVNNFLRNHGIATGRQWRVNVDALHMRKMYKLYDYFAEDRPSEVLEQDEYLTFFADVKKGISQHFAMYTFPNEVKTKIGDRISPYYYLIPKFKAPLFQNDISLDEFKSVYKTENNENPLPPRGRAINPDIIHIEIARYVELFGNPGRGKSTDKTATKKVHERDLNEINLSKLVDIIQDDMKQEELEEKIDVSYDIVRNRYIEMVERTIIYPGFGLDMMKFDYTLSFCLIKKDEIYRIMKAFSQFNIVTALAYTENDKYLLHLQYPKDKENDIFQILNYLDPQNETFKIVEVHNNRVIPHEYYFEKEKK
ncbi:MAG: hypothetical protein PVF58_04160 [Candidatus Methanofastidiosia archaeon]|jgi:hypothetical protein